jgi:acetyl-CoA/propionyl-CoA carboxylase, biotin carboxylase, biotin carboxyl carrier protein
MAGTTPRILIANRGEIAVRVIRTCRELGIPTVAVYSDADRQALHVDMADDAYRLGPASPSESYLNVPRILEAADRAGATAVHPGYGFLAENADFAAAVGAAGLTFIGPPPEAMAMLGDKMAARRAAESAGAPITPGTLDPISAEDAPRAAERVGFPLVVKAAFGGGGKGMRLVNQPDELEAAVTRSAREAQAYFGRPEVFLERYISTAHHVEAQILADDHGNVVLFGERDCSLQRRNQKLVEESPSPVVDGDLRARIGEAATAIARAAGYRNAGTVEFLLADDGSFYFMEVNARLQVEHPVTEMVTGFDLVRLQILAAMGERIDVDPEIRGHAIECRLNAEDPAHDFLPGPGRVTRFEPPGGPFVRLDAGVAEGREVVGNYDSLIGKLICWGEDRDAARRRTLRALDEMVIGGIPTTASFHRWALQTPEFIQGRHTTRFVEAALADGRFEPPGAPAPSVDGAARTGGGGSSPFHISVEVDGHHVPVLLWGVELPHAPAVPESATGLGGGDSASVTAPMQGTILQVMVEPGQDVAEGQVICILEAMKMENHIASARDGVVRDVAVRKGDVVQSGAVLVSFE